jgi:hypothetical protein
VGQALGRALGYLLRKRVTDIAPAAPPADQQPFPRLPQGDIISVDWGMLSDC